MPRPPRNAVGDEIYHVLNRSTAGIRLFESDGDYAAFEKVLAEAHERVAMRTIAYCVMPNHWHFVLWPEADGDLSEFMHWLTATHTTRWQVAHNAVGTGHLYQGRFKSFPIKSDKHYLTVCRYVERNPLRAGSVERAQDWRHGSLWRRMHGDQADRALLSAGPMPFPRNWSSLVDRPMNEREEDALRRCVLRGRPFGDPAWVNDAARRLGLETTLHKRGRPKKGPGPFSKRASS